MSNNEPAANFQDIILRLHRYWGDQGCLIWQPYSEKVGAGTMNPATVLQVVGPEPWNVGYAEPSYRPDDGRFGENPNRMQMHTQYQVILKPDPGNPQELYLESLRAIGIDTDLHDIRFVEDNWESPALGAWGLGWEVWLDGLEITQFTYFQQSASQVLDMPAVEITYGLERIAMFLQGVRKVWDIDWDGSHTYGDVLLQPEIDHCRYDFEVADVDRLTRMYGLFEEEARSAIAAGLVIPAHDYVLRCSHTFNILDARGAIGVTERAAFFARMRDLARQVAEIYLAQRESKGFPLLEKLPPRPEPMVPPLEGGLDARADFVLEVGVEELPPAHLRSALEQWDNSVYRLLLELRLPHEGIRVMGTPRRLVAWVRNMVHRQADRELELKGPPANRAFDESGKPTKAAEGFARTHGVPVESLEVRTEGDKSYVVVRKKETGQSAGSVLAGRLSELISGLKFPRGMRWNHTGVVFSRPIRWLLALHGNQVVPFEYAGLVSGRTTRGPRPLGSPEQAVADAPGYLALMKQWQVIVDRNERREAVSKIVRALCAVKGAVTPEDPDLLDEVTDLVECPTATLGEFEAERLSLPKSVLITVMKKHQRYFPVVSRSTGELKNMFAVVFNGSRNDIALVRQGYEDVLRARYADADYFVKHDLKQPLESFVPRLRTLTFQEKLGSMGEKQERLAKLIETLMDPVELSDIERGHARRAAALCKADLVTSMVIEMTSLQGILGEVYAREQGEPAEVAQAIREHYLPRSPGDDLPRTKAGLVLGLADRLDSLVGLFAVGLRPTGSADPYGLRRTALGLVRMLLGAEIRLDLREHLSRAAGLQPVPVREEQIQEALAFVGDRVSVWFKDQGLNHDVVEAAVAERGHDPYGAYLAATSLARAVGENGWTETLTAYSRCKRIVRDLKERHEVRPDLYQEASARELHRAWQTASGRFNGGKDAEALLQVLRELQPAIDRFFDDVLVMAEDPSVRQARLGLVQRIAELPDGVADFSKLEGF